jgi:hypothetical protein
MNEQAENISGNEQAHIADQAMEGMGVPADVANESQALEGSVKEGVDPIQQRLGRQAEKHRKEMRMMQERLHHLESRMATPQESEYQPNQSNTGQPEQGGDVNDQISKAVAAALRAKDEHERQMAQKMADKERQEHMAQQYQSLDESFDKAAEKYEDFDDIVRHPNAPFTDTMRDYALTLDNAPDVLYKLGKNPEELKRISKLRPIDQAKEMFKLSVALMGGNSKPEVQARPMGQIKGNPVASHAVTEKTSVSDLRQRMKNGGWK